MRTQTQFTQIFDKLVAMQAKSTNIKSTIKSKLLSKDEKEFVTKNLDKFIKNFEKLERKIYLNKCNENNKKIADKFNISVKKYIALRVKSLDIVKCFNAGYSMGGVIELYMKKGVITQYLVGYDTRQEYSKSCRYKAIHGHNNIVLTVKQLEQIEIIGGIPTIKLSDDKITECLMLVGKGNKNNYKIEFEKGFLTKTYHGNSYQECVNWRNREYMQRLKERNPELATIEIEKRKREALNKFVGFEHSIKVGNCINGTKAFAQKHNLDMKFGYRLGYLVELEPTSHFVQKLFNNFV